MLMGSMKPWITPRRGCRAGQESATVRSYMAHHQGMVFLSLAYLLLDRPMQRRFESDPMFRATDLLLQERVPKSPPVFPHPVEVSPARGRTGRSRSELPGLHRRRGRAVPEVHLLSNGRYHVAVTAAGGGYSRWRDLAVTRWREDATRDCWGTFCYLRDVETGEFWSAAQQPTPRRPASYEAIYLAGPGRVQPPRRRHRNAYWRSAFRPRTTSSYAASRITNRGRTPRTIELTSYAEVVLATRGGGCGSSGVQQSVRADATPSPPAGDPLHPPAALGRGATAVDAAPDDRAWHGGRRDVL